MKGFSDTVYFFLLVICMLFGGGFLCMTSLFKLYAQSRKCSETVNAVCIRMKKIPKNPVSYGRLPEPDKFTPEWEYTYHGKTYRHYSEPIDERLLSVREGSRCALHINPAEFYIETDRRFVKIQAGIGAFCVFVGGLMLFLYAMKG